MPIYEYRCQRCEASFEVLYPTFQAAQTAAPGCGRCGTDRVERLVSLFSLSNRVAVGPGAAAYPYTWEQVKGGKPEVLRQWHRRIEREQREEAGDPELTMRRAVEAKRRRESRHSPDSVGNAPTSLDEHGHDVTQHRHGWQAVPFVRPNPPTSECGRFRDPLS